MKKRKYYGICCIDPSWYGFGVLVYIPSLDFEWSESFNITGGLKTFSKPNKTIDSISEVLDALISDFCPMIVLCDLFVIEQQYKAKMKTLQWITMSCLRSVFGPDVKIDMISALRTKRIMGIELQKNHSQNKKEAVKYVNGNKERLLCGELECTDHNIADCVLLLNAFIEDKSIKFDKIEMSSSHVCSNCNGPLQLRSAGPQSQNPGRQFMGCPNYKNPLCKKVLNG